MDERLPAGKLPAAHLRELLRRVPVGDDVLLGGAPGRDAAAVRLGDQVLILKSDPVTFATDRIGWYAVNVNANDIACMGGDPRWMLATVLLPEGLATPTMASGILDDLLAACAAVGAELVGGHTEITVDLDRPIVAGLMVGVTIEQQLIDPRRARPGDALILTQGIAIEGTALIARERAEELRERFGADFVDRCRGFLDTPGISVVHAARVLRQALGPALHALHDPTEGGLATGLRELAENAGSGVAIDTAALPVYPETAAICDHFGLDPLGLIASGALLAAVAPEAVDDALTALKNAGIPGNVIGELTGDVAECVMRQEGQERPLPAFPVDELARLFAGS